MQGYIRSTTKEKVESPAVSVTKNNASLWTCGTVLPSGLHALMEVSICHIFRCLDVCLTGKNTPALSYEIVYV
jgi:hypothetical protein